MTEIEVGEYVRTKLGEIAKIVDTNMYDNTIYKDMQGARYYLEDIVNHSKNIIDLIEVGDYVNGKEVKQIVMFEGFPDYPKLIFTDKKYLIPGEAIENKDIKTIITKEQFNQNSYKVVE